MLVIYILGIWNMVITVLCYFILKRKRILFNSRIAMTVTMISAMVICMHVSITLSLEITLIFVVNVALGMIIGLLFGALIQFNSIFIGFYNGTVGGLMGAMLAEVLKNPQLCSIPLTSKQQILINIYQLSGFTTLLLTLVIGLVLYSLKI